MITTEDWSGTEIYKLENNDLAVWVSPNHGANIFRIKDKKKGIEILHHAVSPEKLSKEGEYWGTPVLFPPNRTANGRFDYRGQEFQLPINTPEGHNIHGLLLHKSWRFNSLSEADGVSSLSLTLDFMDYPEVLECFPIPLHFEMKLILTGRVLSQQVLITNRGTSDAPVGLGLHTWFHLAGGRDRWNITMPFSKIWELGDEVMPTGELLNLKEMKALCEGISLRDKNFDTIFYIGNNKPCITCTRDDGYSFTYEGSDTIKHWVLHTPTDYTDVLSIEPYSWVTNAPNLSVDPAVSGFRVIKSGESFDCTLTTSVY